LPTQVPIRSVSGPNMDVVSSTLPPNLVVWVALLVTFSIDLKVYSGRYYNFNYIF
jgi:hypothetical protein